MHQLLLLPPRDAGSITSFTPDR